MIDLALRQDNSSVRKDIPHKSVSLYYFKRNVYELKTDIEIFVSKARNQNEGALEASY